MALRWRHFFYGATLFGTFEPWLAGDRQTADSVAKARNPEQKGVV
jgi:hypothetical protein